MCVSELAIGNLAIWNWPDMFRWQNISWLKECWVDLFTFPGSGCSLPALSQPPPFPLSVSSSCDTESTVSVPVEAMTFSTTEVEALGVWRSDVTVLKGKALTPTSSPPGCSGWGKPGAWSHQMPEASPSEVAAPGAKHPHPDGPKKTKPKH